MNAPRRIVMHAPHVIAIRLALESVRPRPARWVICRRAELESLPGWRIVAEQGDFVGLIEPARTDEPPPPASTSGSTPPG